MTQEDLRKDLIDIEQNLSNSIVWFLHDIYEQLRRLTLKELLELQIKEFDCA